jgi:hypothetical protein
VVGSDIFDVTAAEVDVFRRIRNFLASSRVFDEVANVLLHLAILQR